MRLERLPGGGVRVLAAAKVNLYLEILGLRSDGYHEIDTILQEVSLHDEIEFRLDGEAGKDRDREMTLEIVPAEGGDVPLSSGEDNLVLRAAKLFLEAAGREWLRAPLRIRLTKKIPMGAGLGGGSSDAAATLVALSSLSGIHLDTAALLDLSARLGSDVAFFIHGGTARCQGRGEKVTPLGDVFGDDPPFFVLVYPEIHVPTSFIYRELDRMEGGRAALTIPTRLDNMSPDSIGRALRGARLFYNRLEAVALKAFPEIESCKKEIQKEPFIATVMSGSGSTLYGVTRTRREAEENADRLRQRIRGSIFVASCERGMRP